MNYEGKLKKRMSTLTVNVGLLLAAIDYLEGSEGQVAIAKRWGVSQAALSKAVNRLRAAALKDFVPGFRR